MVGFLIIAIITIIILFINNDKLDKKYRHANNEIKELQEKIVQLKDKDFIEKEKRLMDLQAENIAKTINNITQYESIKVERVALGNMARAFKSPYVWLQLKDMGTLEMTDGSTMVTLRCNYAARQRLRTR